MSADARDACVDVAAEAHEVELGVGAHDGLVGAGDEEEDGACGVDVDEDLLAGAGELDRLHVDVVLEARRGLGAPRGVVEQGAGDLGGGHGDGVGEDGHGDDHVYDDLVDGAGSEDEVDGGVHVAAALAAAEEGGVGVRGGDEVAVDGGGAEADAEAVGDAREEGDGACASAPSVSIYINPKVGSAI